MSDYTPSMQEIRDLVGAIALSLRERRCLDDVEVLPQFDRAITKYGADAWDEGARAQASAYGMDVDAGPNPYRAATLRATS